MISLKKTTDITDTDGILVTDPYNLRYITGFRGGEGIALYSGEQGVLFVDSRYTEAAMRETKAAGSGFIAVEFNREHPLKDLITEKLKEDDVKTLGFEDRFMTCSEYVSWKEKLSDFILKPVEDHLTELRRIKTPEELRLLRKAEAIGDTALAAVVPLLKVGMTELEVAAELEYQMKKAGAEGLSFDTIAASGLHSAMPHAIPSDKKLEEGDFLTMDFGCRYQGYCSDMTRTVVIGHANEKQKKIYNTVLEAQLKAMNELKPGMRCCDVDKIARDHIEEAGYGSFFGHGLGHSVGLYIHESPALNTRDETVLEPGMIETIEPGIYIPGFGGVRIEDMGVVTEEGYESFASSPKELIELKST